MASNKKVLATLVITTIVLIMLRKRIATALNNTPFALVSDKLFNVIASLEGFVAIPIWDYMQYSVGYGSGYNWDAKRPVLKTDVIDKETAKKWLLLEAQDKYEFVMNKVRVPVTNNQLLAMASFSYNVGKMLLLKVPYLGYLTKGKIRTL